MPNAETHQIAGALITASATALWSFVNNRPFKAKWPSVVLATAVGAGLGYLFGRAPDVLEPAYSPRHRAFFHSVTALAFLGVLVRLAWMKTHHYAAAGFSMFSMSYASHLVLDSTTQYGLPWLGFLIGGTTHLWVPLTLTVAFFIYILVVSVRARAARLA